MANFEVGEVAEHIGNGDFRAGEKVEILAIGKWTTDPADPLGRFFHDGTRFVVCDYKIQSLNDGCTAYTPEKYLRKLPPKHQADDLKAAEPQFINHQLPRWLGAPRKEKVSES